MRRGVEAAGGVRSKPAGEETKTKQTKGETNMKKARKFSTKFFELTNINGGTIMGVAAKNIKQAMKQFKEDGFTGGFLVNEHGYNGKVKKGLCIQL